MLSLLASSVLPQSHQFPVHKSTVITGLRWLGAQVPYPESEKRGDSYAMTWAFDGNIYASAGDPVWGLKTDGMDFEKFAGGPLDYVISKTNEMYGYTGWGGEGCKPTGMISMNGLLYLGFGLNGINGIGNPPTANGHTVSQQQSSGQIVYSTDTGKTWLPPIGSITTPMFPGWKFGCPSFIQYGKNNEGAPDTFVYAVSGEQWDNGDNMRLGRVGKNLIMDKNAWEWVSGFDTDSAPLWTHNLDSSKVLLSDPDWLSGFFDAVYIPEINRYLISTWHFKSDMCPNCGSELIIYDAPQPWGPYTLAHHDSVWENTAVNPYSPHFPLKWFDGATLTGWMQFSGSWINGGSGPNYRSHVRRFQLLMADSIYPPILDTLVLNQDAATFYGSWVYSSNRGFGDFGDDIQWTTHDLDSFVLSFTGTGIDLIEELALGHGRLDLYLDGVFQETVFPTNTGTDRIAQSTVWGIRNLEFGEHQLKGVARLDAENTYGVVDAFRIFVDTLPAAAAIKKPAAAQIKPNVFISPGAISILPAADDRISDVRVFDIRGILLPMNPVIIASSATISRNRLPNGLLILEIRCGKVIYRRTVVNCK